MCVVADRTASAVVPRKRATAAASARIAGCKQTGPMDASQFTFAREPKGGASREIQTPDGVFQRGTG